MIQIAWILCDAQGNKIDTQVHIIKPEGFIIPTEASNVHGITTEMANEQGIPLIEVLHQLNHVVVQNGLYWSTQHQL